MEKESRPTVTKMANTPIEANTTFSLVLKRLHIGANLDAFIGRRFSIRVHFGQYGYTSSAMHIKSKDYAKDGFVALKGKCSFLISGPLRVYGLGLHHSVFPLGLRLKQRGDYCSCHCGGVETDAKVGNQGGFESQNCGCLKERLVFSLMIVGRNWQESC